jgi:DNA-binding MarR family transcriptional regulator
VETGYLTLYQSLKAIFLHIDNHEKALFNRFDLSIARFYALMHIYDHPGINYIDLSNLMLCTKGNTTRIVAGLQSEGLVDRVAHPSDGRAYKLTLTGKGETLYKKVHPAYISQINLLMSHFNPNELLTYSEVSRDIESRLAPAASVTGGV